MAFRPLQPVTPQKPKKGLMEKIARVGEWMGMKPLGETIARGIFELTPERKMLEEMRKEERITPEEIEAIKPEKYTAPQVFGSAVLTALAAAPIKIPLPFTKGVQTLPAIGKAAGVGVVFGVAGVLERGEPTQNLFRGAVSGAITGAGVTTLFGLSIRGLEKTGISLTRALTRYSRNPAKASEYFVDKKIVGTSKKILGRIDDDLASWNDEIKELLGLQEERISKTNVLNYAVDMKRKSAGVGARFISTEATIKELKKAFSFADKSLKIATKKTPTLTEWNWMRQRIDKRLGERAFEKALQSLPNTKENLMLLRTTISDIVKNRVKATEPIFAQMSAGIAAKQSLRRIINYAETRGVISLPNILAGTLVGAPWFFLNQPHIAVMTALGAVTLRSPVVKGNIGMIMKAVSDVLGRPLSGIEAAILYRLMTKGAITPPTETPFRRLSK